MTGDRQLADDLLQDTYYRFLRASGQVLLNIDTPATLVFVTDSDFSSPDPEMPAFQIPQGNSHQSYWDQDGDYVLSTDEDFSPTRPLCEITTGPNAGATACDQFAWTVPIGAAGGGGCNRVWRLGVCGRSERQRRQ